jgi:hypothetical protein
VQNCRGSTLNRFARRTFANQAFANWVSQITFRKSGKPRIALTAYRAKITTRRNPSEWSALEKPVAPPLTESRCLPEIRSVSFPDFHMLELAKGFEPLTP